MRWWHDKEQAEGTSRLASELDRARRYGHQLALVKLGSPACVKTPAGPHSLDDMVRACDKPFHVSGDLYLALPETGRAGAEELLGRLGLTESARIADDSPTPGIAVFPDDVITASALLAECRDAGAHSRRRRYFGRPSRQRVLS